MYEDEKGLSHGEILGNIMAGVVLIGLAICFTSLLYEAIVSTIDFLAAHW